MKDGRTRRREAGVLAGVVGLLLGAVVVLAPAAMSTPLTQFEIADADIVDGAQLVPGTEIPDWGSMFGRTPSGVNGAPVSLKNAQGMTAPSFVEDLLKDSPLPSPPCDAGKTGDLTIFAGAGSDKNGDAIDTWTFKSGSIPPNKDDITNLYAAAKLDTNADRLLYFGLERSSTNGSGHLDVEFLKAPMGRNVTGADSSGCPSGTFTGSRTAGDLLVSLNFASGGTNGIQDVRIWDGDSYELASVPSLVGIVEVFHNTSDFIACGDWNCRVDGNTYVTDLPADSFVEGYVNATALGLDGCFSGFNAKSRSSAEYNSELKDVAFGEFNTCDANISITPDGVNPVGTTHAFTASVNSNASGSFQPAPDGTQVQFSVVSGPGSFVGGVSTCTTTGGSCSVSLTSTDAGTSVVAASTTLLVGPVSLTRSTNGNAGAGGSGNATKYWADGSIRVTPDGVNAVGQTHAFDIEFTVLPGGADTVSGVSITPTITPGASSAPPTSNLSTCASPSKVGNVYSCTVTINSSSAGVYTASASATATVSDADVAGDSATITRTTASDATNGPTGTLAATKTYVDARLSVGPSGLNPVDAPHVITGTLETKTGEGAWVAAPAGTSIAFSATGAGGFTGSDSCLTNASGQCSVTIVSSVNGVTTVNATSTVSVSGVSVTRATGTAPNTAAGGSGAAVKKWVDASITILESAVNEVGDDHVFTVTVTAHRPTTETVTFPSITPSVSPAPDTQSSTCATPTVAAQVATCTFTINDATAGSFDVDATAVVQFAGGGFTATLTRSTGPALGADPGPSGNTGATKTFVDARVSLGPDGVNAVDDPHTVEGFAEVNDGTGWAPAPAGTTITFAKTSGVGGFVGNDDDCDTIGTTGRCTVQIVSSAAGVQWVNASVSTTVRGVTLNRVSATGATDAANLRKEWVTASITISPTAVNPVGIAHAFTIVVTGASSGAGVTITDVATSVAPAPGSSSDNCGSATQVDSAAGATLTCTLTINSSSAGVFTAGATAKVTIGTAVLDVATDGEGASSGPAKKTYVDARISLSPSGVNEVDDPHPMTALLEVNDGTGWKPAGAGRTVGVAKLSGPGSLSAASCTTVAAGTCVVTLNSDTAGVTVVEANASVVVLGQTLVRSTNTSGQSPTGNVTKRWVDAAVSISPTATNPVGAAHTFTITATAIRSGATLESLTITPAVTPAPDSLVTDCATPTASGEGGDVWQCVVTITDLQAGVFTANATVAVRMGGVDVVRSTAGDSGPGGSGPATKTYVDADIQIGNDGVNEVGNPHAVTGHVGIDPGTGRVNAADGTTIAFAILSGPGQLSSPSCKTAGGTGSCAVSLVSTTVGVTEVRATSSLDLGGVPLTVTTNGTGRNSDDLTKRWVDAFVTIGESAVNPLNEAHVFTVRATDIPSGATPVVFDAITTSVAPEPGTRSTTCGAPTISGNVATCTLTINSAVEGTFVANATVQLRIGTAVLLRSTDAIVAPSGPGGSGAATKRYREAEVLGVVLEQPELPRTGADVLRLVVPAGGAVLFGGLLVLFARRRRST